MKYLKVEMTVAVDDNKTDEIRKWEHHIDHAVDLDNYPEIHSISDVKVTETWPFCSFINDKEKMRDYFSLSKREFLESYSYLTEEEYDMTAKEVSDIIANTKIDYDGCPITDHDIGSDTYTFNWHRISCVKEWIILGMYYGFGSVTHHNKVLGIVCFETEEYCGRKSSWVYPLSQCIEETKDFYKTFGYDLIEKTNPD